MKYSLRSLFFATTVIAAVLGRMRYLHCQAQYHDRNFERIVQILDERPKMGCGSSGLLKREMDWLLEGGQKLRVVPKIANSRQYFIFETDLYGVIVTSQDADEFRQALYHRRLANAYGQAVCRPWTIVDETP